MKRYRRELPLRALALSMSIFLLSVLFVTFPVGAQEYDQNQYFLWTQGYPEKQLFLVNAPHRGEAEESLSFFETLQHNTTLTFTHMQPGRYFHPDITPEINIWFNAGGDFGPEIHFSLEFDADTDQVEELFYDFPSYTIEGEQLQRPYAEHELASLEATGFTGSPVDMSNPEIGGRIIFKVWRNDTQDDVEVKVMCGRSERDSWITIPYLSTPVEEDTDDGGVPWGLIAIIVVIILVISVFLIIGKHSTPKPDPEELRKARKRSQKKGRKRKKGKKGKKG